MKQYRIIPTELFHQNARNIFLDLEILTQDRTAAKRIYKQILDTASSLSHLADCNQAFGENRIQQAGKYSIVYQINGDTVELLRVVPSSCQYIAKIRGFT